MKQGTLFSMADVSGIVWKNNNQKGSCQLPAGTALEVECQHKRAERCDYFLVMV